MGRVREGGVWYWWVKTTRGYCYRQRLDHGRVKLCFGNFPMGKVRCVALSSVENVWTEKCETGKGAQCAQCRSAQCAFGRGEKIKQWAHCAVKL